MHAVAAGVSGTTPLAGAVLLIIGEIGCASSGALNLLQSAGFRVLQTRNGCTGAALVRRFRPDVVVLDVDRTDGRDLSVLAAVHRAAPVPVIVVAATDQADPVTGLEMGADDFMVKPIAAIELVARARAAVRRAFATRGAHNCGHQDGRKG
jgi:DNA-binding response OmpR family regulator